MLRIQQLKVPLTYDEAYLKKELSVNQGVYEKLRVQESERTKERSAEVLHMIKRAEDLLDRYF